MNRSTSRTLNPFALDPRAVSLIAIAVVFLLLSLTAPHALAQRSDPLAGLDSKQRRVFQNYTRLYCAQFFKYGQDRYVLLPNHYRKRENSNGRSYDQAEEEMTETRKVPGPYGAVDKKFPPPKGEVIAAAMIIPSIDVGHYGHINSVRITQIVGPEEMIVSSLVLIPKSQVNFRDDQYKIRKSIYEKQRQYASNRYRLLGFRTDGLRVGDNYTGPQRKGLHVAVMSTDPQHDFVMVNYDKLQRVRTSEFAKALGYVSLTPLDFIDMVRQNKEQLGAKGDEASMLSIYRRYYNRYRPKRLSSIAAVAPTEPIFRPTTGGSVSTGNTTGSSGTTTTTGATTGGGGGDDGLDEPIARPTRPTRPEPEEDVWDLEKDEGDNDELKFFGLPLGDD